MPERGELLAEIRRLRAIHDRRPTLADLKEDGRFSQSPYYTEFGSWNAAIQETGLNGPDPRAYDIPDEDLLEELARVASKLGEAPTRAAAKDRLEYSVSTYEKRFGSWNDALQEVGLVVNRAPAVEVDCDQCGTTFKRPRAHLERDWTEHIFCSEECHGEWREGRISGDAHPQFDPDAHDEYGPNWGQFREDVIARDGGQCVRCGIGREQHQERVGRDLSVHHLTPRSEFDDVSDANTMDNAVTVCSRCHKIVEERRGGPLEVTADGC